MAFRFVACLFLLLAVTPAFAQEDGNDVVARVNGVDVTRDDVATAILQLPPEYQQVPMEVLWAPILEQVIDRKLLAEAAIEDGLDENQAFQQQINLLREEMLQQAYLQQQVDAGLTTEALEAAYEQYVADFDGSDAAQEIHARHILVTTEDEANALIERLDDGEDFAELAMEASIGPSGPDGGDLGFFKKEEMVPEFGDAAFALEPGETSQAVESPFGWHVIKVEERREASAPAFEEIASQLSNELAEKLITEEIDQLRADADIEMLEPATEDNTDETTEEN